MELDPVDNLLKDIDADGPLLARLLQAIKDFEPVEGLPAAVLLNHRRKSVLGPFARGKPLLAAQAFPPPPDRLLILSNAGIDHLTLRMAAKWTLHLSPFHTLPSTLYSPCSIVLYQFDPRLLQHRFGQGIGVTFLVDDLLNARIDDHLGADDAGMVRAVKSRTTNRNAVVSCLDDGILFRMQAPAQFVAFPRGDAKLLAQAACIEAMFQSRGSPIVPGGQDFLVLHKNGADLPSDAGGPLRNQMGDIHEVLFPRGSKWADLFSNSLFQG